MRFVYLVIISMVVSVSVFAETLVLGTGSKGKGYHALGKSIQKVLKDNHFGHKIIVKSTSGSTDNLIRLRNGEIDLAIVQSDTAFYAENGRQVFAGDPVKDIGMVISFYKEPLFIVTKQKNINNIKQLTNARINIGPRNSGLAESAKTLLHSAGIWDGLMTYQRPIEESKQLLNDSKLQAIFLNHLGEKLSKEIEEGRLFVVSVSRILIENMNRTFPYFYPYEYKIDDLDKITTLSTVSILIAKKEIPSSVIQKMISLLETHYPYLVFPKESQRVQGHFIGNPLSGWHSGALEYFTEKHITVDEDKKIDLYVLYAITAVILIIILVAFVLLFILHHADIFHRYSSSHALVKILQNTYVSTLRHKYLFLGVVMILAYTICVLLIKYFEHEWAINNNTVSVFDNASILKNLSWLFVFGSSGYNGDIFPSSNEGKLVTSLVPLLGVGGIFAFIGLITFDQFKKYFLEVNGMASKRVKDHIILCGWNENSHFILENLLHKNITERRQIVILANDKHEESIKKLQFDPMHVFYVKGEATKREDLHKSNIAEADIAIVISDSNDTGDPDARIILKVLTIEKYCLELEESGERKNRSNIHTIAEISESQNITIAEDAGVDQVVSLGNIESKIFTQAVQNPGVAVFINEIMTYNDQNDIYSFPAEVNSQLYDKTYDEILIVLRKYNILLLSINIENRKPKKEVARIMDKYNLRKSVITNPIRPSEQAYCTHEGDLIIVLAQYEKVVTRALKELKTK